MADQYSFNGSYPQEIPDYWKFDDGTVRTDLQSLNSTELEALGWFGPIEMTPTAGTNFYTHTYAWNSGTKSFDATEIPEIDKPFVVDYHLFWNSLIYTDIYTKIKTAASSTLAVNTSVTEFIALLSDAKNGSPNEEKIQSVLTEVLAAVSLTTDEIAELQTMFNDSGMFVMYTLS